MESDRPRQLTIAGPALRLIPATPVENNPEIDSDTGQSQSNSTHTSAVSNQSVSRTSSAKSRTSLMSTGRKNFHSASFSSLMKKSTSDKEKEKSGQPKKSIKRSIRLVKNKSMRAEGVQDTHSEGSIGRLSKKSSFSRVLDKIRGVSRRSSVMSGSSGGQADFLASLSRMSDSRIVENWLLSIEDDKMVEPPPLLETISVPSARCDQTTPTNELFDSSIKATEVKPTFELSSEDSSSREELGERETLDRRRSRTMFKPLFGRQYSESSEYTTDTHDTGETAHVTAMNTLSNTGEMFTSVGDEIKKVTLSPSSQAVFRPIPSFNEVQSCLSTETLRSVSSNPGLARNASVGSDLQGISVSPPCVASHCLTLSPRRRLT